MGKNDMFAGLGTADAATPRVRKRTKGLIDQRESTASEIASGAIEDKIHRWVDPASCRIWEHHNRRYDLLNEERCSDLIEGIKAQGRQEFPAIVRKLDGDPEYDYEVICGARRHWTISWLRANNYPEFRFLIEPRDLTDEQAFRLSDIENRDRDDISDYERAVDYKNALARYYPTQKAMAQRLEVSEDWLSRYLFLAELPQEVVDAYADIRDIRSQHARELRPMMKSKKDTDGLIKAAKHVAAEQETRRNEGRALLDGSQVVKLLKARPKKTARKAKPKTIETVKAKDGTVLVSGTFSARQGWTLKIPLAARDNIKELTAALEKIVQ